MDQGQQPIQIINTAKILTEEKPNFFLQQFYTGCLAEASYYIESEKTAIVIDPLRDTTMYTQLAEKRGATIKFVFLTHFHADFVSGHLELQRQIGCTIVYGPTAQPSFEAHIAKNEEKFDLGKIQIQVMHTPGHTMESSTFVLLDENKPYCIFTGDTLFLGEVGRPDLAVKGEDLTKEDLAGFLFDSLNNVIKAFPDETIVYPGHGAGSSCGKNIQSGTFDTLGNQKQTNYALKIEKKEEFVKTLTANILPPPIYFMHDVKLNKTGYSDLKTIVQKNNIRLTNNQFLEIFKKNESILLDTRDRYTFMKKFVKGSYCIDVRQPFFATWIGKLFKPTDNFLFIIDEGNEQEVLVRLARVGFENCSGIISSTQLSELEKSLEFGNVDTITPTEFKELYEKEQKETLFLDVRETPEKTSAGYLEKFVQEGLWGLEPKLVTDNNLFDKTKKIYVMCAGGYRSILATALLTKFGYNNLVNINDGLKGLKETEINVIYP